MQPTIPFTFPVPVYRDNRGSFTPIPFFDAATQLDFRPLQFNVSISHPNVVRGMHWQQKTPQAKLIMVVSGSILDVAVNLDPTNREQEFGAKNCFALSSASPNGMMDILYVPKGYAHGFKTGPRGAVVIYAVDAPYDPEDERGFSAEDIESFGKIGNCTMSEKDRKWPKLAAIMDELRNRIHCG